MSFPDPAKREKPPRLREAQFEDHRQILALASKFGLHVEEYERWKYLWAGNPAYIDLNGKLPKGWILESPQGEIAGYLGNIPINYEIEGKRLIAATTRAWVVDTPYRSYSPLLLATYFAQRNIDLFLSTTINEYSAPAYNSFQTLRVPVGTWDRAYFWITNYRGFAESFLRRKQMGSGLGYALGKGIFLLDRIQGRQLPGSATSIEPESEFDDRFEEFWQVLRKSKSHTLSALRGCAWWISSASRRRAKRIFL